ncbi:hypothetical protein UO65_3043 [Actinokineospora spheciospongiae]|uniref:SCO6045-like C-terminal domain-containing protein n=1 Tax=Actinokineospora spheciospongiae TaxID=909613 RepID=W7ILA5_9PSEU|nr:hypothetical protein [Actinokineospora spheciospongiae]EWC61685.1 hypothetical protein UO65_3043 [Actinokineospora spheciospongiae]
MSARERLAARQAELLAALLADGPAPAGFDAEALRVEADALLAKRRRVVALIDPEVAESCGEDFAPLFAEYARGNPRRDGSRAREDAAAFAAWVEARRPKRRWWQGRRRG